MDPNEARLVLKHAEQWSREGLLSPAAYQTIEIRLGPTARLYARPDAGPPGAVPEPGPVSRGSQILYATGGAVLGAAAIALVTLSDMTHDLAVWTLLLLGIAAAVSGIGMSQNHTLRMFGDALLVAGLVAFVGCTIVTGVHIFDEASASDIGAGWISALACLAIAASAPKSRVSPPLGLAGWFFASAFALQNQRLAEGAFSLTFAVLSLGVTALVAVAAFTARWRWTDVGLGVCAIGTAVASAIFTASTLSLEDHGAPALAGTFFGIAHLALAVAFRKPAWCSLSAVCASGFAVVFGFTIGGAVAGVGALLVVALGLLAAAHFLKRWFRAMPDNAPTLR